MARRETSAVAATITYCKKKMSQEEKRQLTLLNLDSLVSTHHAGEHESDFECLTVFSLHYICSYIQYVLYIILLL